MGKTNGATTTKPKAKESPKAATKTDRKSEKLEKVEKNEKAEKADKKADKKVDRPSDKKSDKTAASSVKAVAPKAAPPKPVVPQIVYKSPFPADELVKWRQVLMAKRHEVTDDIAGLVKDAMDAEDGHTTPNHIAERGSDADLQDLSLGVAGEEKDVVWQIDRALRKIDANRPIPFGLCEHTKEPIPRTRLQLIPWTPLSIEGATHLESNNLTMEDLLIED
jgi:RNA polymerase-binding transcription factor DksA